MTTVHSDNSYKSLQVIMLYSGLQKPVSQNNIDKMYVMKKKVPEEK